MISITENGTLVINLHGTLYTINNPAEAAAFKADMGWFANAAALVEKYLSKMVRMMKWVSATARIAARDAYNYTRGLGAPSFWQEQRLRWHN